MLDQEIYKKIGKLLYNEAPNIELGIHIFIFKRNNMTDITLWCGEPLSGDTNFAFSREALHKVIDYAEELYQYFIENNMGKWNTLHYTLSPDTGSFDLDFEFNKKLQDAKIPLFKHLMKFK